MYNRDYSSGKNMVIRSLIYTLLIACILSFYGCSSSSNDDPAKTTVLIYIEGTNLEDGNNEATKNINEILAANPSNDVNIILATGAAKKEVPTEPVKSWKTLKRHMIRNGRIEELQDLGEKDMGDPEVLKEFIVWGQRNYPAQRYILILWDHGGGSIYGYGGYRDRSVNPPKIIASSMSITTIQRAVGDAVGITRKKFDIIGFDACLMATVETANCLSDYGKYMAASQEIEPGGGWDYTALFNAIAAEPGSGGLEIGKVLADSYAAKCIRTKSGEGYTFSIIDMSEIDDVVDVLDELGSLAYGEIREDGANAWNELGIARMFTEEFGAMYVSNRFFNMADIEGFAERLGIVDEDTYGGICRRLVREIEDAVKYNIKGDAHEDASGLSVYLPYHVFTKAKSELPKYWDITFAPDYQDLINEYVNYPLDNPPGTRLAFSEVERAGNTLLATVSSPYDMAEIFIDVNERPAGGNYIKKSQDLVKLEDDEDGGILYTLTGRWFTFDGRPVIGYFEKGQGFWDDFDSYDIAIPVYYRRAGEPVSKNTAITIQVDYDRLLNIGTVEMAWVTEDFDNVSSKDEVVLAATDIITPIYEVYDPAKPGEKTMVNGDEFALSTGSPVYARTPVPSGIVYYNFRILDLAGNLMRSSLTEVVVP